MVVNWIDLTTVLWPFCNVCVLNCLCIMSKAKFSLYVRLHGFEWRVHTHTHTHTHTLIGQSAEVYLLTHIKIHFILLWDPSHHFLSRSPDSLHTATQWLYTSPPLPVTYTMCITADYVKSSGPFPITINPVHCRLLPPITPPPSTEVLWRLCKCSLIRDGNNIAHNKLIEDFVDWCQQNHLQLNAGKTKELVVDYRRHKQPCTQVNIQGLDIEMVTSYKYLRVHLNNKLDWTDHTAATYNKDQSRLYLLRKLRSFVVQGALLTSFYDSVVSSAVFYGVVCWSSSISTTGRKRLDKTIKSRRPLHPGILLTQCRWWDRAGWWTSWWRSPTPCRSLSQHWAATSATDWYTSSVWRWGIAGPSFLLSDCATSTAPSIPHHELCNTNSIHNWFLILRVADTKGVNRLICKVSDVVGVELDSLTVVSEKMLSNYMVS